MSSTPNRARRSGGGGGASVLLLALAAAAGVGGCANGVEYEPQAETVQPMVVDEAMQTRDWEPVAAYYANGDTIGGIDRAPVKPRYVTNSEYVQGGAAPFLFVAQALVTPISFLWAPPFEPVATQGEAYRPTYTGAPPVATDQPTPEEQAEQRRLRHEQIQMDRETRFNDRDVVAPHGRNVFPDEPAPRSEPVEAPAPEGNAAPPAEVTPMEPVPPPPAPAAPAETPPADAAPARPAAPEAPARGLGPGAPGQSVPNEAVPAQPAPAQPAPELNK